MADGTIDGGCACGAARYRLTGAPISVNACYCTYCQRQTGSTGVVNAFYEAERIAILSGDIAEHVVPAPGGRRHVIRRCAACGTALFSHYARFDRFGAGVRVGTLDDPAALRPDAAIFVADRMPWVALPMGFPAFPAGYDVADVLPPARLARFRALAERRARDVDATP